LSDIAHDPVNVPTPFIRQVAFNVHAANDDNTYPLETCGMAVVEIGNPHKVKLKLYGLAAVAAALLSSHRKRADEFSKIVDQSGITTPPVV